MRIRQITFTVGAEAIIADYDADALHRTTARHSSSGITRCRNN